MELSYINEFCIEVQQKMIDQCFGNIAHEIAYDKPQEIGERYNMELVKKLETAYYEFLKKLWKQLSPDGKVSLDELLDKRENYPHATREVRFMLEKAYEDAKRITVWEKITKSNHEDVHRYKALLCEYAQELLDCLRFDFIEDVEKNSFGYYLRIKAFEDSSVEIPEVGA